MTDNKTAETPEAAFTAALAKFQADIPHIGKDQTANTGSYSYSYADLTDITRTALPLLATHGFAWNATTKVTDSGFMLMASLKHEAGHTDTCEWPLPDPSRNNAQQVGSALTYARRYTFTALTGIAPGGEDDDAQTAAPATAPPIVAAKNAVWAQAQRLGWDKEALTAHYAQDNGGQAIDSASPADLHRYAKQLASGTNGLPLNKDGSVSLRQTTEEQRVEAGMMSDEERKAHKDLVAEATTDEKKADRERPDPTAEDPWATIEVAKPGGEAA